MKYRNSDTRTLEIVRVSSRPSVSAPGAGLAALMLSKTEEMKTHFFSYILPGDALLEEDANEFASYLLPFPNPTMPKTRAGFWFVLLQSKRVLAVFSFFGAFILHARKIHPNIVHLHSPMHFLISIWAKMRGAKVVVTLHGTDFLRVSEFKGYRLLFALVDAVFCVTHDQVLEMKRIFPKKHVALVSNGVDIGEFRGHKSSKVEQRFVAVGSLRWHKDFSTLIKAFELFNRERPGWELKIIGEGPDRNKLQSLIDKAGLSRQIQLPGVLSRLEVQRELTNSDVFVLSSVTEGLPKVLLEAMASGCACVTTDVGDCSYVLNGTGLIVRASDERAMADAMLSLFEDGVDIREMGVNSQLRAQKFEWSEYKSRHKNLYQQILSTQLTE